MQPLSGPAQTQTTDMLYARAVGEHRHAAFGYAGGRAAGTASVWLSIFRFPIPSPFRRRRRLFLFLPLLSYILLAHSLAPSLAHSVLLSDKESTAD